MLVVLKKEDEDRKGSGNDYRIRYMHADSLLPGNNIAQSEESHEDSRLSCVETFPHPGQMTEV